jgi:hypothetical protein
MADNETPIVLPAQTDGAEAALTNAVQATAQAADQHIEPGSTSAVAAGQPETAAPVTTEEPDLSTAGPKGSVIATH